jgi:hypothetical protein
MNLDILKNEFKSRLRENKTSVNSLLQTLEKLEKEGIRVTEQKLIAKETLAKIERFERALS